jgi:hypothetical protein
LPYRSFNSLSNSPQINGGFSDVWVFVYLNTNGCVVTIEWAKKDVEWRKKKVKIGEN